MSSLLINIRKLRVLACLNFRKNHQSNIGKRNFYVKWPLVELMLIFPVELVSCLKDALEIICRQYTMNGGFSFSGVSIFCKFYWPLEATLFVKM